MKESTLAVVKDPEELQKNLQKTLTLINKNLKEVGVVENQKLLTNGTFKTDEHNQNQTNIHTCGDVNQLIKCFAILKGIKKNFDEISQELGVKTAKLIWCGFLYEQWENDFKIRIRLVANAVRIKSLQDSKVELETFLSADRRLELTLEKVKSIFTDK